MVREGKQIVRQGDRSGNGMVFKIVTSGGIEIFGMATKNFYGGNWDLGPTWNYLVLADEPFLVDTGRTGTSKALLEMIGYTGFHAKDLKNVVLSHGHEDHDGGLAEIVNITGAGIKAHMNYKPLIKLCPESVPEGIRKDFPPSCWHCIMPDSFTNDNCRDYHLNRDKLVIDSICEQNTALGNSLTVMHLPGHSPDGIAILIDEDVVIVGDNVLPHISPAPSLKESFDLVGRIFPSDQPEIRQAFGLDAYLRSLKSLIKLGEKYPDIPSLPGHRLYYFDQWHDFQLETRANEIIEHHLERCHEILKITRTDPKTIKEIMVDHFDAELLEGLGAYMARNEIKSHLELLLETADMEAVDGQRFLTTGSTCFESHIQSLKPW